MEKSKRSPQAQANAMAARWHDFELRKTPDGTMIWRGFLRPKMKVYEVAVLWNASTMSLPWVSVVNPKIKPRSGTDYNAIPHLLFDSKDPEWSGLCLFDPAGTEWDPSLLIADTTIIWASEWLLYYELWHLTGKWLGPSVGPESVAAMLNAPVPNKDEIKADVY